MSQPKLGAAVSSPQTARLGLLLGLLAGGAFLWLLYWMWIDRVLLPGVDQPTRGQFGDMFGAANALFSALAFAGLVYAIVLQRHDLGVQIANLGATLRELQDQGAAFKEQNSLLRDGLTFQTLDVLIREYRSVEMGLAIHALREFQRHNGGRLAEAYRTKRETEMKAIDALGPAERIVAARGTLHFQRRLVTQFYSALAVFYSLEFLAPRILYTQWIETDLRIIPEVLLPMEIELGEALDVGPPGTTALLQKLYDDSRATRTGSLTPHAPDGAGASQRRRG